MAAHLRSDVDAFTKVLSSFTAKDKILRFLQYLCRFNKGIMQQGVLPLHAEDLKYLMEKNWSAFRVLMDARRVFRLFNSVGVLKKFRDGLKNKPWGDNLHPLYVAAQFLSALWPAIDHYRFLILIKWAEGSQAEVLKFSYRLFTLAQLITCLAMFIKGYLGEEPSSEDSKEAKRQAEARWNFMKAGLTAITIGHISSFPGLVTNEIVCGGTAMVSSAMDLYKLWPKVSLEELKMTTAKEDASARLMGISAAVFLSTLASVSFIRAGGMK
mmetsp:Transcript_46578/g.74887  ORF Transcript_46578/g.74887 Transcript_46578/m.74887 type:complete len:269 (-) Transcript_46578:108-914(-)|eukprot:jgi/Bigna1/86612/estExt_fgenesh1_pg.C_120077